LISGHLRGGLTSFIWEICVQTKIRQRSAEEYRQKSEEMKKLAAAAADRGDDTSRRSYDKLAEGWREMVKHAERHGRLG
jgi:hypothetical protein